MVTLLEMKKKVLALIEELNPDHELLTDDPDIAAKIAHGGVWHSISCGWY
jgi:hypothetical protein